MSEVLGGNTGQYQQDFSFFFTLITAFVCYCGSNPPIMIN